MKKPVVDYRKFRFSKLNDPEFSHLKLFSGWILYFVAFYLVERLIPGDACHVMHCALDDVIPFCEYFALFYVAWYGLLAWSMVYFALYDIEGFRNLMKYTIITQVAAVVVYLVYPSCQQLRPETFPRDNLFSRVMGLLYAIDTNTNVFPSLHVAFSLAIGSAVWKTPTLGRGSKWTVEALVVLICLSTMFVKQHSVLDVLGGLGLGVFAEILVYRKYWGTEHTVQPQKPTDYLSS